MPKNHEKSEVISDRPTDMVNYRVACTRLKTTISHDIVLNGNKVEWTDEWPYLGVTLKSAKMFACSVSNRIKKFYRCANAILRIDGRSNDMVMLRLMETHCVPMLTYAIEIVHVMNRDERRQQSRL